MNEETLDRSTTEKGRDLQWLLKQRRYTATLWGNQVDAAAKVDAGVDGGGGAPKLGDARKMKQKGSEGKRKEMTLRSYL